MSEKKRWNRKTAGKILILAGSFIIIFVIALNIINLVKRKKAINDFKNSRSQVVVERIDENGNIILQYASEEASEDMDSFGAPDENIDENATICLLRIPKINVEEAVREGSTQGVLASTLGHVEKTAYPGEDGNCCIAGHRNNAFGKFFAKLDEVAVGDIIELETRDSIYTYEVTWTEVVEPEEVGVLAYAEGKNLTLITCTTNLIGTKRLIVHAVMK